MATGQTIVELRDLEDDDGDLSGLGQRGDAADLDGEADDDLGGSR